MEIQMERMLKTKTKTGTTAQKKAYSAENELP